MAPRGGALFLWHVNANFLRHYLLSLTPRRALPHCIFDFEKLTPWDWCVEFLGHGVTVENNNVWVKILLTYSISSRLKLVELWKSIARAGKLRTTVYFNPLRFVGGYFGTWRNNWKRQCWNKDLVDVADLQYFLFPCAGRCLKSIIEARKLNKTLDPNCNYFLVYYILVLPSESKRRSIIDSVVQPGSHKMISEQ